MADDNWQKVREIFDSALRHKPEERRNYLVEVCGADKTLLSEVESLFASLDSAESFMETPAVAEVADVIESETKKLERGKCFGHYEIVEQIGAGGMGEVYLARDKKLDRQVAVKILNEKFSGHESNLQRFVSEAKAASALNHPNILTIYEFGEAEDAHFIVSEYIEGETLREAIRESRLRLPEILDISIQITGALSTAHKAHLVHRDIKPENVMIRPDGYVKILDFGLAKLIQSKQAIVGLEAETARQNQTAKGVIMGTVNYMSPEQSKGEKVDERTDIFSFGVVIYEMLTGRTPFAGNSVSETFANLLNGEPQPMARFASDVPAELQRIVSKMLRKGKDERYQTMQDLLTDLKDLREHLKADEKMGRFASPESKNATAVLQATTVDANKQTAETQHGFSLAVKRYKLLAAFALVVLLISAIGLGYYFFYAGKTASGAVGKKSIAVLPLKPINTATRDEIYEIGIADSLILKLSSMKGFIVRPLSAMRKYADIGQDALAAGREQQTDYVLASNYQLAGGKIRVTAQLFNVASGQIEETYKSEKDAGNIFAMQDAIAGEMGNLLLARFATTSSSPMAKRGTTDEEAYRLYLQGMYFYDNKYKAGALKSIEAFEQALSIDPNYARAWAGLSHAHRVVGNSDRVANTHQEYQKSIEAIDKALALDENLSEAQSAACENKMYYEYDFAGAERSCLRAIELDPNSALAHQIYSRYLTSRGRFDEAIDEIKTAIDLEPAALFNHNIYGVSLYYARRYPEAVAQFKQVLAMDEGFGIAYYWLYITLAAQGNELEAFERFMTAFGKADEATIQAYQAAYQTSGWPGVMRKRFEKTNEAYFFGAAYNAQAGNKDQAFEYLEKSYQRREMWMAYLQVEPRLDPLRDDPRYDELVRRVESK